MYWQAYGHDDTNSKASPQTATLPVRLATAPNQHLLCTGPAGGLLLLEGAHSSAWVRMYVVGACPEMLKCRRAELKE